MSGKSLDPAPAEPAPSPEPATGEKSRVPPAAPGALGRWENEGGTPPVPPP
jgi:hypothetical protein